MPRRSAPVAHHHPDAKLRTILLDLADSALIMTQILASRAETAAAADSGVAPDLASRAPSVSRSARRALFLARRFAGPADPPPRAQTRPVRAPRDAAAPPAHPAIAALEQGIDAAVLDFTKSVYRPKSPADHAALLRLQQLAPQRERGARRTWRRRHTLRVGWLLAKGG